MRTPYDKSTNWELCVLIEREIHKLGTDDNCPVPEHTAEERRILEGLLGHAQVAKRLLTKMAAERDEHDGRLVSHFGAID
jgi:hypothetical protein